MVEIGKTYYSLKYNCAIRVTHVFDDGVILVEDLVLKAQSGGWEDYTWLAKKEDLVELTLFTDVLYAK